MDTPSKDSRVRNVAALAVLGVAIATAGYIIGRDSVEKQPPPAVEVPRPQPMPTPPITEAVMGRADLIALAADAADQAAGGVQVADWRVGRRFLLRMAFGCDGPVEKIETSGWSYNAEDQSLRVRVAGADWTETPWVQQRLGDLPVDSIEGYWLPRPWTSSETCPPPAPVPAPVPAPAAGDADGSGEAGKKDAHAAAVPAGAPPKALSPARTSSLGIATFSDPDASRVGQRRGRPLEIVQRVPPEQVPQSGGLQLVIEGRIAAIPGGRESVLCQSAGPYLRPTCLVATAIERVAVVNPGDGKVLGEWRR
ncbi:hypothetical protein [Sphingomonas xanthus]|uniref:Uncharacterized protein n=1 Tax=Sphingomonas xanthus TaxID=2594473 RepID=A0A516IPR3_9SPHN|nr:hypothetical protein [Sphingomonas xanthus]QDP18910.1 hypothetical protein FMM02_02395 [Sphingomonas xanthus]